MLHHLRGTVTSHTAESAVIDVGGVGYLVHMPASDAEKLDVDTEAFVHVYTHVREDQLALFGFAEPHRRTVFTKLIGLSGVGPKLALAILSTFTLDDLRQSVATGDESMLTKVPGVGKKTAQRLALELGHVLDGLGVPADTPMVRGKVTNKVDFDVQSALVNLGYSAAVAEDAIAKTQKEAPTKEFEALLRGALSQLRGHK